MRRDIETCRSKCFNVWPNVICDDAIIMAQVHGSRGFEKWPIFKWDLQWKGLDVQTFVTCDNAVTAQVRRLRGFNVQTFVTCDNAVTAQVHRLRGFNVQPIVTCDKSTDREASKGGLLSVRGCPLTLSDVLKVRYLFNYCHS
jgi:hypothetical protein